MATTILVLFVALSAIFIIPLIDIKGHSGLHRTDLMAGDEGED